MSLKDFKEQCKQEDSFISDLKFLDSNKKELSYNETQSLYSLLTNDHNELYLQINDNVHAFPTVSHENLKYNIEDLKWFKKCS